MLLNISQTVAGRSGVTISVFFSVFTGGGVVVCGVGVVSVGVVCVGVVVF